MPQLGDGPIEEQYVRIMRTLASTLDEVFNGSAKGADKKVGFCLMVFNFGDGGRANYISNANREDVVILLKEQLARFQGQPETKGTA